MKNSDFNNTDDEKTGFQDGIIRIRKNSCGHERISLSTAVLLLLNAAVVPSAIKVT